MTEELVADGVSGFVFIIRVAWHGKPRVSAKLFLRVAPVGVLHT